MKNIVQTSLLFFLIVSFGSCKKSETSNSMAVNSLSGKKYKAVEATIYEVPYSENGGCEGWYIQATNPSFDFMIKIDNGLTDSVKSLPGLDTLQFYVDFTFTGRNTYCEQPYRKKIGVYGNYPYEIQMVSLTKITKMEMYE